MITVHQKNSSGCGIACIAMMLGKSYSQTKSKLMHVDNCITRNRFRINEEELENALNHFKIKLHNPTKTRSWQRVTQTSIVQINKIGDRWHWVVFDSKQGKVRDPQSDGEFRCDFSRMRISAFWPVKVKE